MFFRRFKQHDFANRTERHTRIGCPPFWSLLGFQDFATAFTAHAGKCLPIDLKTQDSARATAAFCIKHQNKSRGQCVKHPTVKSSRDLGRSHATPIRQAKPEDLARIAVRALGKLGNLLSEHGGRSMHFRISSATRFLTRTPAMSRLPSECRHSLSRIKCFCITD